MPSNDKTFVVSGQLMIPTTMPQKPIHILVVDDDADTCANLADILSDIGYTVKTAHNATVALQALGTESFDVVLLDLKLPGMDGLQLYREVKRASPTTVAILVTGFADADTRRRAGELGVWRIVPKPVDVPLLLPLIAEAARQPLLLIVDDDPDFCGSLFDVLHEREFRVCAAHSAAEAAEQLGRQPFQIVLSDWRLPDTDGLKFLNEVRQARPQARTVLLTAFRHEFDQLLTTGNRSSIDVFLYKPLEMENLLDTLRNWTSHSGSCFG